MFLERPLAIIDLEATGLDRQNDRIVEISVVKMQDINPNSWEVKTKRLNPTIPIHQQATAIHGITDEMVANVHTFRQIAQSLFEFLKGCDIGGFGNLAFDVPMLYNEFLRCGIEWDYHSFNIIDCSNIFKQKEPRDLTAAVHFYCNDMHEGAHGAEADALATARVFCKQLEHYPDMAAQPISEIALYSNYGRKILDLSGKFTYNEEGEIILNFGPHRGQPAKEHLDFIEWMLSKQFAPDTIKVCLSLFKEQGVGGIDFHEDDHDECPY